MVSPDLLIVGACCIVGNALAVWGVVRHELRAMRSEIRRAHSRIDTLRVIA